MVDENNWVTVLKIIYILKKEKYVHFIFQKLIQIGKSK